MTSATRISLDLPPAPSSPAAAREFVSDALRANHVAPETMDIARLLTSELVTNAVVHARSPISVSVRVTDRRVRVEVGDEADVLLPAPVSLPASTDTARRGLAIVSRLARDWGVERHDRGKSVWFELRASRA